MGPTEQFKNSAPTRCEEARSAIARASLQNDILSEPVRRHLTDCAACDRWEEAHRRAHETLTRVKRNPFPVYPENDIKARAFRLASRLERAVRLLQEQSPLVVLLQELALVQEALLEMRDADVTERVLETLPSILFSVAVRSARDTSPEVLSAYWIAVLETYQRPSTFMP